MDHAGMQHKRKNRTLKRRLKTSHDDCPPFRIDERKEYLLTDKKVLKILFCSLPLPSTGLVFGVYLTL